MIATRKIVILGTEPHQIPEHNMTARHLVDSNRAPFLKRLSRQVTGSVLVLGLGGCATIGLAPPVHEDKPMSQFREEVPTEDGASFVEVTQDGPSITIDARKRCHVYERQKVRRRSTTERFNTEPGKDWALGLGGTALVGLGFGLAADAQNNVYDDAKNSRTFNEVGPTPATILGATTAALGTTLITVAIVDGVRASGADTTTEDIVLEGTLISMNVACEETPIVDQPLVLKVTRNFGPGSFGGPSLEEAAFQLGKTNAAGRLQVDLVDALAELDPTFVEQRAVLLLAGKEVGHVDVEPVVAAKEEVAWGAVNFPRCQEPKNSGACAGLKDFVSKFPNGRHKAEADRILAEVQPRLDDFRDDEMWNESGREACSGAPKLNDTAAVEAACRGVAKYRAILRTGKRVAEADGLLKKAQDRVAALRDRVAKNAAAEEAREAAKERTRCDGECRLVCSSRRFNFDVCYSGCVAARCTQ